MGILFGELINYLDIFDDYHKHFPEKTDLLKEYFKIDKIYLGFTEYLGDYGSSEEHSYLVNSSTGKSKITDKEFLKYIQMFNPLFTVLPFEYVPSDGGKKRVLRCYKKLNTLFEIINEENVNYKNQNFIIPFYTKHIEHIPMGDFNNNLEKSKGILVITEKPEEMNYELLQKYKKILEKIKCDIKIKANLETPFDILLGKEMGCTHIELNFPTSYSEKGMAMDIDFTSFDKSQSYGKIEEIEKFNFELCLLNMSSNTYETNMDLLTKTCECFVCKTGYKKSYIHHLIKCKELNGNIILSIHNIFQAKKLYEVYDSLKDENERKNFLMWFISKNCCPIKENE